MAACRCEMVEVVRLLLEAGADRNLADNNGGFNAPMLARHGGVGWLLQEAGFDNSSSGKRRHYFFDDGIPKRPR